MQMNDFQDRQAIRNRRQWKSIEQAKSALENAIYILGVPASSGEYDRWTKILKQIIKEMDSVLGGNDRTTST
jgi:hypothetical protein